MPMSVNRLILRFSFLYFAIYYSCVSCTSLLEEENPVFQSNWKANATIERPWAGPEYWLNPLQAWEQKNGSLQVVASGGDRNCVLLTRSLNETGTFFEMSIKVEAIQNTGSEESQKNSDQTVTDGKTEGSIKQSGWVGFQIGLQGAFGDYRDDAVHGRGFCAGITTDGILFIGALSSDTISKRIDTKALELTFTAKKSDGELFDVTLTAKDKQQTILEITNQVHSSWLKGAFALTCSQVRPKEVHLRTARPYFTKVPALGKKAGGNTRYAFSSWKVYGDKVDRVDERAYGPILWAQYTLSDDILKLSAQFSPVGNDNSSAELWIDGNKVATESIATSGANALFRIPEWDSATEHSYSIKYQNKAGEQFEYNGQIQANKLVDELKVASLSCVDDVGFPHQDLVDNVLEHNPDLYVFHGDQLYERVGGYGVERKSKLDYLRKWYIFGWCFREFMRNRPVVIIPDDHDVFHGNLWGEGGKLADISLGYGYDSQDSGGYKEGPAFVNMVHRTQTGHLPDPYDPTPVKNDISVYYTNYNYRGLSFAILGDRQWKSAPKRYLPDAEIENGWPQNKQWNAKTQAGHPDVELLGPRQETFLETWVENWSTDTYLKAVISQSPFCNVATLPADIYHDKYVPKLPRYRKDGYPEDDRPVADFDSNGWPQNKRNKALRTIRKAFALHFAGDQHLGSTGAYGVDTHGDAGYWIASPAVSNLWPRRWFPAAYGLDGKPEKAPRYTGKYEDGFGNKITVKAIANPYDIDREPDRIFDKAPGYSIITFDIENRKMELAAWPRWASPQQASDNTPYEGWPIEISQEDNYGRKRTGNLQAIEVDGTALIRVFEQESGELQYALKPPKGTFTPFVFDNSKTYEIELVAVGAAVKRLPNLKPN